MNVKKQKQNAQKDMSPFPSNSLPNIEQPHAEKHIPSVGRSLNGLTSLHMTDDSLSAQWTTNDEDSAYVKESVDYASAY